MNVNKRALRDQLASAQSARRNSAIDAHRRIDILAGILGAILEPSQPEADPACYAVRAAKAAKPEGVTWKQDVVRAITDAIRAFGPGDMDEIAARTINQLAEAMGRLMKNDVESARQYLQRAEKGCPELMVMFSDPPGGLPKGTKIDWEAIGSPQALIVRAARVMDVWIETRPEKNAQPGPEGAATEPA